MMTTPIADFLSDYAARAPLRLHMPGHKGQGELCQAYDLTEVPGADSLYEASGIIRESEQIATALFGCHTFYSTEGSSLAIRAMLHLALLRAKECGLPQRILAGRNAHKVFLSAAALLDFEISWLTAGNSCLSCPITARDLEQALQSDRCCAVYLTSPDYLGNTVDLRAIAEVCKRCGVLLLVDNAHGAYLKFLSPSQHPMDLGADLCCASAHKTLPVLTGGAYLHIRDDSLAAAAKTALSLFGSTSPSYLILRSLDLANRSLLDYSARIAEFLPRIAGLKAALKDCGYPMVGDEPLKLTLFCKPYGYTGVELAAILAEHNIVCEFSDPDFLVLMFSPDIGADSLAHLEMTLRGIPKKAPINSRPPRLPHPRRILSVREAALAPFETVSISQCIGRVLASPSVSCPPAVPVVMCGEQIDEAAAACFAYYGITECVVVKDKFFQKNS